MNGPTERAWPAPPYYAEDMARLLRDAADQPAFQTQGGSDYCKGLTRAAELVEEFGVRAEADRESAGLRQRLDAIEALHHRYDDGFGLGDRCVNDGFLWPCSTVLAAGVVDNPEETP